MFHCEQQLVFVDEVTDHEIRKTAKQNLPGIAQYAVDETDDEDEESLRQKESIAENRRLDQFRIIYTLVLAISKESAGPNIPLGVLAPIKLMRYNVRAPISMRRSGNRPKPCKMMKFV